MLRKFFFLTVFLFTTCQILAQAPSGVPYGQPDPLEFDLVNIIIFIVIPVIIVFLFIFWRKRKNRKK